MSRSYPTDDRSRLWRMYCDSCAFVDSDRFKEQPPLEHFVAKGWFIGVKTDRCPACYRSKGAHEAAHSAMAVRVVAEKETTP